MSEATEEHFEGVLTSLPSTSACSKPTAVVHWFDPEANADCLVAVNAGYRRVFCVNLRSSTALTLFLLFRT